MPAQKIYEPEEEFPPKRGHFYAWPTDLLPQYPSAPRRAHWEIIDRRQLPLAPRDVLASYGRVACASSSADVVPLLEQLAAQDAPIYPSESVAQQGGVPRVTIDPSAVRAVASMLAPAVDLLARVVARNRPELFHAPAPSPPATVEPMHFDCVVCQSIANAAEVDGLRPGVETLTLLRMWHHDGLDLADMTEDLCFEHRRIVENVGTPLGPRPAR